MTDEPRWVQRFRAARVYLPESAADAPHRSLYLSNAAGRLELYTWDRETDTHRQVTDRPNGTRHGTLDPTGEWVWWFADTDGDEWGVWMREPFDGSAPPEPAAPGLEPSFPGGLGLGRDSAVIARSTDDGATVYYVAAPGAEPVTIYEHPQPAYAGALSRDDRLVSLIHSEHGDVLHPALKVLRASDGEVVGELNDGPDKALIALRFAPVAGDSRLLVQHERRGRTELLIWDPLAGSETELRIDLPGELSADWYPDATALVVVHSHAGRSEIFRYDLATAGLSKVDTPRGMIDSATVRPDGTIEFSWSSSELPLVVRSTADAVVLAAPGEPAPPSVPMDDARVEGPGGQVHALICRPADQPEPYATVFVIHGGPASHDADEFRAMRAAYVDAGYCVIHVNYRGSTGYGSAWRDALIGRPGLTELEDIAAVHDWAVGSGLADPARCAIGGGSWGGYLTLLGLGTQPDRWALGIADVPVADYVAEYEDELEDLRAGDRTIFGGSPDEVPELYARSSPITYIDKVRVPVLILAGENDARCPIRQINNYLDRLTELGVEHEVYRYEAGHGSVVVDEQIRQMHRRLEFLAKHMPA